ncbi:MAG: hypothetical protein K2H67_03110 [Treponemataceae bacterium]|nr:hypothetical protein [Treponemataceae bacterium]
MIFFALVLFSCFTPSPLYGTWSDNLGNKITFSDDMSYTAIIAVEPITDGNENFGYETETFSGSFSVAENVLSLSTEYGLVVTEWDIRGSILYLDWTMPQGSSGETIKNLRLYHN